MACGIVSISSRARKNGARARMERKRKEGRRRKEEQNFYAARRVTTGISIAWRGERRKTGSSAPPGAATFACLLNGRDIDIVAAGRLGDGVFLAFLWFFGLVVGTSKPNVVGRQKGRKEGRRGKRTGRHAPAIGICM